MSFSLSSSPGSDTVVACSRYGALILNQYYYYYIYGGLFQELMLFWWCPRIRPIFIRTTNITQCVKSVTKLNDGTIFWNIKFNSLYSAASCLSPKLKARRGQESPKIRAFCLDLNSIIVLRWWCTRKKRDNNMWVIKYIYYHSPSFPQNGPEGPVNQSWRQFKHLFSSCGWIWGWAFDSEISWDRGATTGLYSRWY